MKRFGFIALSLCFSILSYAQAWVVDEMADEVRESYNDFGTMLLGAFVLAIIAGTIYLIRTFFTKKKGRDESHFTNSNTLMSHHNQDEFENNSEIEDESEIYESDFEDYSNYTPVECTPQSRTKNNTHEQFVEELLKEEEKRVFPKGTIEEKLNNVAKEGFVDLGLSVKWSALNESASEITDLGYFYRWGSLSPLKDYDIKKLSEYSKIPYSNELECLKENINGNSKYDIAFSNSKGKCRMPTPNELQELIEKCQWKYIEIEKNKGFIITGPSGKSIYLPLYYHTWVNYKYEMNVSIAVSYHSGTPCSSEYEHGACSYSLNISNTVSHNDIFKKEVLETFKSCFYPIRAVQDK